MSPSRSSRAGDRSANAGFKPWNQAWITPGVLSLGEQRRGLVGEPKPTQVLTAGHLTRTVGPLAHGAGFFDTTEIGDQLGTQQVSKLGDQLRRIEPGGVDVRQVGSCGGRHDYGYFPAEESHLRSQV